MRLLLTAVACHKDSTKMRELKIIQRNMATQIGNTKTEEEKQKLILSRKEELAKAFENPIFVYDLRNKQVKVDRITHLYQTQDYQGGSSHG